MSKERIGNGVSRSGGQNPQSIARESTPEASPNTPSTETTAQPAPPEASATPRTSRADAKYQELLAKAREIMADPEFMEEVMALARLKARLREDVDSLVGGSEAIKQVLNHMIRRNGQ